MGIIKLLLISVVLLFLVVLGISALLPSEIRISRAVDIRAEPDSVIGVLKDLATWQQWNEFVKPVSSLRISGDSLLSPELNVVLSVKTPKEIGSLWLQPGHPQLASVYVIYPANGITTIQWYFTCHFKWYPWEKFGSLIYDNQLGKPMELSLQHLKKQLESARR